VNRKPARSGRWLGSARVSFGSEPLLARVRLLSERWLDATGRGSDPGFGLVGVVEVPGGAIGGGGFAAGALGDGRVVA
jgi:hypothetical protein